MACSPAAFLLALEPTLLRQDVPLELLVLSLQDTVFALAAALPEPARRQVVATLLSRLYAPVQVRGAVLSRLLHLSVHGTVRADAPAFLLARLLEELAAHGFPVPEHFRLHSAKRGRPRAVWVRRCLQVLLEACPVLGESTTVVNLLGRMLQFHR